MEHLLLVSWFMALSLWAVAVAVGDLRQRRIANLWLLPGLGLALVWLLHTPPGGWPGALAGSAVALAALLPAWWLGVLGGGDLKLAALLALIQPDPLLQALVVAILLVLGLGLARRARGGTGGRGPGALARAGIPFAPFLVPPYLGLVALRLFG